MRISSPPTQWPCYYGIDTPTRAELIGSSHSIPEINQYITSDTLGYLSLAGLKEAVISARVAPRGRTHLPVHTDDDARGPGETSADGAEASAARPLDHGSFCHACWSGEYPIRFTPAPKKLQLRLLHL